MGDIVEFTTIPKAGRNFFKITSNGLNFDIKTRGVAFVGFAQAPLTRCTILLIIGANHKSYMTEYNGIFIQASTPNIINGESYRRFWVIKAADHISFGQYGQLDPVLKHYSKTTFDLNYITFFSIYPFDVHWKVEVPPSLIQTALKPISKGELRWEYMGEQLPKDALIGGFEKEPLYIIRKIINRSLLIGKYVPSERIAYVSWNGAVHRVTGFEILCGYDCVWVPTKEDRIPVLAYRDGYSTEEGEPLYIARANYCGYIIPGRIQIANKACFISHQGKEIALLDYEILTLTGKVISENHIMLPNDDLQLNLDDYRDQQNNQWDDDTDDEGDNDYEAINWGYF